MDCKRCGHCCRDFVLTLSLQTIKDPKKRAETTISDKDYFLAKRIFEKIYSDKDGRPHYRCRMLNYDKEEECWRCLIHEERPNICRKFTPGEDSLCKYHEVKKEG